MTSTRIIVTGRLFFNSELHLQRKSTSNFGNFAFTVEFLLCAFRVMVKSHEATIITVLPAVSCQVNFSPYHSRASSPAPSAHPPVQRRRARLCLLPPLSALLHASEAERHSGPSDKNKTKRTVGWSNRRPRRYSPGQSASTMGGGWGDRL